MGLGMGRAMLAMQLFEKGKTMYAQCEADPNPEDSELIRAMTNHAHRWLASGEQRRMITVVRPLLFLSSC